MTYFRDELNWDWNYYFTLASDNYENNFVTDKILNIKNVSFKVRDLALSNFDDNYIAFDLHVARVSTRIGLLNYGFGLFKPGEYEMGNNTIDRKNYLFLHKLFLKICEILDYNYSLVDLDRAFWHFGRTICTYKPICANCPIKHICLTGKRIEL